MEQFPSFQQVIEAQSEAVHLQTLHWLEYEVFTFQFWLLLLMLIIPWFIWWKLADRKRLLELIIYGFFVIIVATSLDELGCQLNLWEYRYDLEPYFPRLIPMNFSMLPVIYLLVYQYFPTWKSYIIAFFILASLLSFVGEPLLELLDIYVLLSWKHIYSFPIYIALAIIFKLYVNVVKKIQKKHSIKM